MILCSFISLIVLVASIGENLYSIAKFFGWVLVISIIGPSIWMWVAWNQDLFPDEYYYVETLQYPSGKIVYRVYPSGVDTGCTVECDGPLQTNTIVRVWRKYPWKNGLNWNNERPCLEVIPPTSGFYNDVTDKAQRKGIKIIDVKIMEQ